MAIKIRSLLASGPVWVPLTTGGSVRLSPGQTSAELPDVAMAGNAQADKLRQLGVIDVETVDAAAPPAAESTTATEPVRARKRPDSAK
jgi:hypothetical protein